MAAAMVAFAAGGGIGAPAFAQEPPPQNARTESKVPVGDYYQRALEIYQFRKAAQSGPERGREVFLLQVLVLP